MDDTFRIDHLYYTIPQGICLFRINGEWFQERSPSFDRRIAADRFFQGGHVYTLDADQAAELIAAGFGGLLEEVTVTITQQDIDLAIANHVAQGDPHTQYLRESVAATTYETQAAAGLGRLRGIAITRITTGDFLSVGTSGAWVPMAGYALSVPAVNGDALEFSLNALVQNGGTTFFNAAILDGNSLIRFLSTGNTASFEGMPGWYPLTQFAPVGGTVSEVVQETDITGGNVTVGLMVRSTTGGGKLFSSSDYPCNLALRTYASVV